MQKEALMQTWSLVLDYRGKDADIHTAYNTLNRNQGVRIGVTLPYT